MRTCEGKTRPRHEDVGTKQGQDKLLKFQRQDQGKANSKNFKDEGKAKALHIQQIVSGKTETIGKNTEDVPRQGL